MAFGIDDALAAAAAGIKLTDTVVKTIKSYKKSDVPLDIEQLIEEIRVAALAKIDEADRALARLQRTLHEKKVDTSRPLQQVIEATSWWRPDEAYRLKRIRQSFNALADAAYDATDDIAALARCKNKTEPIGIAVVDSAEAKHELSRQLLDAESFDSAIELLRSELTRHKVALN